MQSLFKQLENVANRKVNRVDQLFNEDGVMSEFFFLEYMGSCAHRLGKEIYVPLRKFLPLRGITGQKIASFSGTIRKTGSIFDQCFCPQKDTKTPTGTDLPRPGRRHLMDPFRFGQFPLDPIVDDLRVLPRVYSRGGGPELEAVIALEGEVTGALERRSGAVDPMPVVAVHGDGLAGGGHARTVHRGRQDAVVAARRAVRPETRTNSYCFQSF